jgi:hypothetical protein
LVTEAFPIGLRDVPVDPLLCRIGRLVSDRKALNPPLAVFDLARDQLARDRFVLFHAKVLQGCLKPLTDNRPQERVLKRQVMDEPTPAGETAGKFNHQIVVRCKQMPLANNQI